MSMCKKPKISLTQFAVVAIASMYLFMNYGWLLLLIGAGRQILMGTFDKEYTKTLGTSLDDFAGSVLFGTKRHTVSANIGYRAYKGNKFFQVLAKIVDWKYFFGTNHCYCLALEEGMIPPEATTKDV